MILMLALIAAFPYASRDAGRVYDHIRALNAWAATAECWTGPGVRYVVTAKSGAVVLWSRSGRWPMMPVECGRWDRDNDGDVDLRDVQIATNLGR